MKLFSLYRVELRRLALSKFVWVIAALSLCGPLFGYSIFPQSLSNSTMSTQYIANPVLAGAIIGALLWAILALLESDRIYRAKTDVLMDAVISPVRIVLSRMLALITLSTLTTLLCAMVYLPITILKITYLFNISLYANSFLILILPTWWISILLASALYQITRRVELAVLLYAGCVYFSFSHYMWNNYFAHWLNPIIVSFSDGFSNALVLRISLYTRVLWLVAASGAWVFSLICIRRYQKGLPGSFVRGLQKVYLPVISAALLCAGVMLWIWQPFINHAPYEWNNNIYTQNQVYSPNATRVAYKLTAEKSGRVNGTAEYLIDESDNSESLIWLDPGYEITNMSYDGKNLAFHTYNTDINEYRGTTFTLPKGNGKKLIINYKGFPKMLRSFLPFSWDNSSSSNYVSLSNAATVPNFTSFSLPAQYDLELTLPENLTPIVEHQLLTDYTPNNDGMKTWKVTDAPGSLGWITACDYANVQFQAAGSTINLLYSKKYDKNIKKYDIPQSITDVMNYCTTHLGPLPFVDNGNLMMVQRASSIGGDGGNAGDGWVEWSEYLFTEKNLSDPLKGAGAAEVFAHEIIHEWWGGLGVYSEDDGLWSDEGLDVYTTYRLMKEKYGALYAKQNYIDIWQTAVDAQDRGYYYRHPEMLSKLPAKYQAELKSQAVTTNKYCRMPLMILKAEQLVGGEENMDKILLSIQQKYSRTDMFTYQEFLDICGLKGRDLELE
jgi:hypothetical protein